jgi:hypothetical protein
MNLKKNAPEVTPETEKEPFSLEDHFWSACRGTIYGGAATAVLGGMGVIAGAPVAVAIYCGLIATTISTAAAGVMSNKEGRKISGDFTRYRTFHPVSAGLAAVQALVLSFAIASADKPDTAPVVGAAPQTSQCSPATLSR